MANLERKQQKIFAENSQATQITAFRTAGETPLYSKDVNEIQNANFSVGWLEEDNAGNVTPYAEDMNGVFYTFTRNLAYLYQKGIPEWSNGETYYMNAMCMYNGVLYQSLVDENTNRQPDTQTSYWQPYASPVGGSITGADNLGTGAGISTGVSNTKIQLKSLVAGTNVTLSEGADSITISSLGGGGSGAVAWGDITGSLASQVDLSTALSQRGTLSGNNTWTGNNTFGSSSTSGGISIDSTGTIVPIASNTKELGTSTQGWKCVYTAQIQSTSGDLKISNYLDSSYLNVRYSTDDTELQLLPVSSFSSLGTSQYIWTNGYIRNLNSTTLTCTSANATSVLPNSGQLSTALGSSSKPWAEAFIGDLRVADIAVSGDINPTTQTSSTLGTSTYKWNIHCNYFYSYNSLRFNNSSIYCGMASSTAANRYNTIYSYSSSSSSSSTAWATIGYKDGGYNFSPAVGSSTATIGTANYPWSAVYTAAVAAGSNTLYVSGNNTSTFYLLPSTAASNRYLGSVDHQWIYGYIDNVISKFVDCGNLRIANSESNVGSYIGLYNITNNWIGVRGNVQPAGDNSYSLGKNDRRWTAIYAANGTIQTSDVNKKDNIIPLEDALDRLNGIPIYSYTWKENVKNIVYGLIAQEVLETSPELIDVPEDYKEGDGTLGVFSNNVLFLAVKAIQELSAKVENLETKFKEIQQ